MNNREAIKLSTSTLKTVHFQLLSLTISGMEELIGPIFVLDFFKCRIPVGMLRLRKNVSNINIIGNYTSH